MAFAAANRPQPITIYELALPAPRQHDDEHDGHDGRDDYLFD